MANLKFSRTVCGHSRTFKSAGRRRSLRLRLRLRKIPNNESETFAKNPIAWHFAVDGFTFKNRE